MRKLKAVILFRVIEIKSWNYLIKKMRLIILRRSTMLKFSTQQ